MIRRLFAFLFRHDFSGPIAGVRMIGSTPMTTLKCVHCGFKGEYPTMSPQCFGALYRLRGCTGRPATEKP